MDIIIRNGVIDKKESTRILNIKNEAGFLKKNYEDYRIDIPGPYYDFLESHICIPRFPSDIKNFYGPQDSHKTKLFDNTNQIKDKFKYCSICHKSIKQKVAFSYKRLLIEEDIFVKKPNECDLINDTMKKMKLTCDNNNNQITDLEDVFEKCIIKKKSNWIKLYVNFINSNIKKSLLEYKKKILRVNQNYYKLCYKLIKKPIQYEIGVFETILLYPWELTPYQNFKLTFPEYKSCCLYSHQARYKIISNYVTVE